MSTGAAYRVGDIVSSVYNGMSGQVIALTADGRLEVEWKGFYRGIVTVSALSEVELLRGGTVPAPEATLTAA